MTPEEEEALERILSEPRPPKYILTGVRLRELGYDPMGLPPGSAGAIAAQLGMRLLTLDNHLAQFRTRVKIEVLRAPAATSGSAAKV